MLKGIKLPDIDKYKYTYGGYIILDLKKVKRILALALETRMIMKKKNR